MRMWGVFEKSFERARVDRGAVLGDKLYLLSTQDRLRMACYSLHQDCNISSSFQVWFCLCSFTSQPWDLANLAATTQKTLY